MYLLAANDPSNRGFDQEHVTMRYLCQRRFLLVITLGVLLAAWIQAVWAQGGSGRGAAQGPAAQGPTAQQAGATGRGGARGGVGAGGGAAGFYDFDTTASAGMVIPDAAPTEVHQKITINGEPLAYAARVGYLPLRNATTGQSAAHLFFTYYAKDGVPDASARPLLVFLGGAPGVAATWQEFGGLGPKRMRWSADGSAGLPPYGWVDNPHTLLDEADLVFVNPVGTAFSRPDQPSRGTEFWTTAADIASLGEFVRSFVSTYDRRNSPLFLAGEDFGTGRAAGLASYLDRSSDPGHGVVLLSMAPSADAVAGDAQYITLLPSVVLAAWHHKKLAPELQALGVEQVAEQARQFASREYLHALYKGDRMTPEERTRVVANLSRLTGLSKAFIVNNNLRIALDRFTPSCCAPTAGRCRTRMRGWPATCRGAAGGGRGGFGGGAPAVAVDYNHANLAGGFLTAYETYLRRDLTFTNATGVFYLSSGGIGTFTSTGSDEASLASAFARNPRLRLFVGVNYFDLNAPFYATEFTVAHLNVSPEVRARNITVGHFEAGQMAYVDNKALARLHTDLVKFMNDGDVAGAPVDARNRGVHAMRITDDSIPILCGLVILVAAMGVVAFAQGRGGRRHQQFLPLQLQPGRDAADRLPGAADHHAAPDHPAEGDDQVHGPRRVHAHPQRHQRRERGASVLRLLFQGRRDRQGQAAALVPVQRRAGRGHHLAAHGRVRPEDGEDGTERHGHAAALHVRGQPQLPARYRRPGLHRRDGHRVQPSGSARLRSQLRRRGQRPGRVRRVHPQLPERIRPLGLAALRRRRELRDDARGGIGRLSHRPRLSHQRRDAALGGHRRQRRRRRSSASSARCRPRS